VSVTDEELLAMIRDAEDAMSRGEFEVIGSLSLDDIVVVRSYWQQRSAN